MGQPHENFQPHDDTFDETEEPFPGFINFKTNKDSQRENKDIKRLETKLTTAFNKNARRFKKLSQLFDEEGPPDDKNFFARIESQNKPLLGLGEEDKKTQKKETDEKPQDQPVSELATKFKSFAENVRKFFTMVSDFFMSLGKDTLEIIAGFTGWKFLNVFIAKTDFISKLIPILNKPNGIPLAEEKLDKNTLDTLFSRYQDLQRSRGLRGISVQQFVDELKEQSPVKENIERRIPVVGTDLVEAAGAISDTATNQMDENKFQEKLHARLNRAGMTKITGSEAEYGTLLTQYTLAQRKYPDLTVESFIDAILAQKVIKDKNPEDVTMGDILGQAYVVAQHGFGGFPHMTVSVLNNKPPPNNLMDYPEKSGFARSKLENIEPNKNPNPNTAKG